MSYSKNRFMAVALAANQTSPSTASTATKSMTTMQAATAGAASTSTGARSGGGAPWSTFGVLVKNWRKRGARWHDTGTWTSADPLTWLTDPSRANPYLYVGGDPINHYDPARRLDWSGVGKATLAGFATTMGALVGGGIGSICGPGATRAWVAFSEACTGGMVRAGLAGEAGTEVMSGCVTGIVSRAFGQ